MAIFKIVFLPCGLSSVLYLCYSEGSTQVVAIFLLAFFWENEFCLLCIKWSFVHIFRHLPSRPDVTTLQDTTLHFVVTNTGLSQTISITNPTSNDICLGFVFGKPIVFCQWSLNRSLRFFSRLGNLLMGILWTCIVPTVE